MLHFPKFLGERISLLNSVCVRCFASWQSFLLACSIVASSMTCGKSCVASLRSCWNPGLDHFRQATVLWQLLPLLIAVLYLWLAFNQVRSGLSPSISVSTYKCQNYELHRPLGINFHFNGYHISLECTWAAWHSVFHILAGLGTLIVGFLLVYCLWCPNRLGVVVGNFLLGVVLFFLALVAAADVFAVRDGHQYCQDNLQDAANDVSCEFLRYFCIVVVGTLLGLVQIVNMVLVSRYLILEKQYSETPNYQWEDETIPGESIYMEEDEASVSLYEEDEDQRERGDAVLASGSFYND